ncbi:MurR/RpiR family transcriptional regulator [Paenibacillus sp. LHD-117]|uniref:MurR/RpiR family transcriptional regulator n=1 Tax=Paenibacillus sp. LHD-117 TaxID=3071412 RepID=UPI0027DF6A5A|nr:MurR/RpiR family transcriptional regulator [Paenibacillus sp. LHD-117]MDQ6422186.1 MurR/RpiR family transcriptional regulator [Paenibacillus sp. LHD-117]
MTGFQFQMDVSGLSRSQQAIANYIAGALQRIPYCTDEEIAEKVGVSTATVSRFWRAIGYQNLKDFKKALQQAGQSGQATPARKMEHILNKVEHIEADIVGELIEIASSNLAETAKRVERGQFVGASEALHAARKIYLHGGGAASFLTELLAFRLERIGLETQRLAASGSELLEGLMHAGSEDCVVLFGFVKRTPELTVLLDHRREAGYRTVLITDLLLSDMLEESDYVLQLDRGKLEGFHSMTAPVAIVEALTVAVTQRRGREGMDKLEKLHALRKRYAAQLPK